MKGKRFAFVFSRPVAYPPNIHNVKSYYVSRELISRGERVTWVRLGGKDKAHFAGGIEFARIPIDPTNVFFTAFSLLRLAMFCLAKRIRVVYLDEWLFFRHRPISRLAGVVALRAAGMKVVMDERDPLVDFETATGEFDPRTHGYHRTIWSVRMSERLSTLLILTSKAYAQLYISEGFPARKVLGVFRGVDHALFNPDVDPAQVKAKLGLDGKFVVGWFGLMHRFRQINEVLIPIARLLPETIPNAQILIGGEGPLQAKFEPLAGDPRSHATILGLVPYPELPSYIAACDVLLCPVDSSFRFTKHSAWLKIAEALAVGKPIIATRTKLAEEDYNDLKGVIWVEPGLKSFMDAILEVRKHYANHLSLAQEQSRQFDDYTVRHTIGMIADRVELLAGKREY